MDGLRLIPANGVDAESLTEAFNRAFEGYYLPLRQTRATLLAMIGNNDVSLADSVVALDGDGELAGVGLLAVRGDRAWVAGMGVARAWRGRGQGEAVLRRLIERARGLGLRAMQLEVLEQNTPARRLYERLGFRGRRPLLVFNGPLARVPGNDEADGAAGVHVARMEVGAALACFDVMHDVAPSWQRERPSLEHMAPQMDAFGAFADDGLRAYALVSRVPVGMAVLDVGTLGDSTERRARYVEAVIGEMVAGRARQPVRVINVPPGDPLGDVLSGLGCPVVSRQWEMVLELDRPA